MTYLILLSILSGILGRLGGRAKDGHWYDKISNTKVRDIGCALVLMTALFYLYGFNRIYWIRYLVVFLLHFGLLTTYWDVLFNFDNCFWSGLVIGLAILPLNLFIKNPMIIILRGIILGLIWGTLNVYLPEKFIIWRKDIAEEFLRYTLMILTLKIICL